MTPRVVDLPRVTAALRALDVLVSERPELAGDDARERCGAWLEGEPPDEAEERGARAEGRHERPGKP